MPNSLEKITYGVIIAVVSIIVVFLLVSSTAPNLLAAAGNLSASNLPLASLFSGSGIVLILFMVGLLLGVFAITMKMHKGK